MGALIKSQSLKGVLLELACFNFWEEVGLCEVCRHLLLQPATSFLTFPTCHASPVPQDPPPRLHQAAHHAQLAAHRKPSELTAQSQAASPPVFCKSAFDPEVRQPAVAGPVAHPLVEEGEGGEKRHRTRFSDSCNDISLLLLTGAIVATRHQSPQTSVGEHPGGSVKTDCERYLMDDPVLTDVPDKGAAKEVDRDKVAGNWRWQRLFGLQLVGGERGEGQWAEGGR